MQSPEASHPAPYRSEVKDCACPSCLAHHLAGELIRIAYVEAVNKKREMITAEDIRTSLTILVGNEILRGQCYWSRPIATPPAYPIDVEKSDE